MLNKIFLSGSIVVAILITGGCSLFVSKYPMKHPVAERRSIPADTTKELVTKQSLGEPDTIKHPVAEHQGIPADTNELITSLGELDTNGLNISSDPFGVPPRRPAPNCGEFRYKFNVTINLKDDFVNFLKNNKINQWVMLDNFKDTPNGKVNWNTVLAAIKTDKVGNRTIYILDYKPRVCEKFKLKMTDDGYVSLFGCCGE
jgi:hypothetical protein